MTPTSLYIHVPFCLRRCSYCDFAVEPTRRPPVQDWLDAIAAELRWHVSRHAWPTPIDIDTLYIGGGTPSLIGGSGMAELGRRLQAFLRFTPDMEWTAEANPETFTAEVASEWSAAGVNRISLGVQTFHAPALKWMGRLHGPEGAERAFGVARAAGFGNVSIDLIFALPARLGRSWGDDLARATALDPEHISLYGLTAEDGTHLGRRVREGREEMADEGAYAAEYRLAVERLSAAGYDHYEVSNFAKPGRASRHNQVYWRHAPYLGLGPGAHSFLPPVRQWNVRSWAEYQTRVAAGASPVIEQENVDAAAGRLERIWLGLRTASGYALGSAGERALAGAWTTQGWAAVEEDRVRLTPDGWLLLDRLAVELDRA